MRPLAICLLLLSCQHSKMMDLAEGTNLQTQERRIFRRRSSELPPTLNTCQPDDLGLNTDDDDDGWMESEGDCNDMNAAVHPDAPDLSIDGLDQNCDGLDGLDLDEDGEVDCDVLNDMDCDGVAPH